MATGTVAFDFAGTFDDVSICGMVLGGRRFNGTLCAFIQLDLIARKFVVAGFFPARYFARSRT